MHGAFSDCHCSILRVQALCVFLCGGTRLPTLTLPKGFSCGTSTIVHVYPHPPSQCALCSCPRPLCGSVQVATSFPTKTSRKFFGDNSQEERKHLFRMVSPVESFAGLFSVTSTFFKAAEAARPEGRRLWLDHRGCAHRLVTASLPRAGLLECTCICSIQTCLLYGHFHMNWFEVQLLL